MSMACRACLLTGAVLTLASCASRLAGSEIAERGRLALVDTPVCCAELAQAAHVPLPAKEDTWIIDPGIDKVFAFGTNKAFFKLYELPAFRESYSVTVTSRLEGTSTDRSQFVPIMVFYDADMKVTRYFGEKTLRSRGQDLERTVFFNAGNADERFLVIFGSDLSETVEKTYSEVTVQTIPFGPAVFLTWASGKDRKFSLRPSPTGTVRIEVQGPPPSKH
jgi:hypothetical protein